MKKFLRIVYIPRSTFTSLTEAKKSIPEIIKLGNSYGKPTDISSMTLGIVNTTTNVINKVLFNDEVAEAPSRGIDFSVNMQETNYVNDYVDDYLKEERIDGLEKYYEIILDPLTEELCVLVIVEKGFLSFVTETKERALDFLLTLLRHSHDQNGAMYYLCLKYLGLKTNEGYLDLVKLRLDRR